MNLRYDPLNIFKASKTAAGLYARQKWMGEINQKKWQHDFDAAVAILKAGQRSNGSWGNSAIETIRRLFGLHLTVRHPDNDTQRALNWLQTSIGLPNGNTDFHDDLKPITDRPQLDGLPFVASQRDALVTPAFLFLASIFGRAMDESVVALYEDTTRPILESHNHWNARADDWAAKSNLLRALVVHPTYATEAATTIIVQALAESQIPDGRWNAPLPFYQIVNALAHLKLASADAQLEKTFHFLEKTQNSDGSWGKSQREWHTFLIIHALRNKKVLSF
ncbi:MAG: hypothetical protein QNI95_06345 [Desulfobacterales bacterium]|nr:hypothetical protein [Desulfobacterales bacterium]